MPAVHGLGSGALALLVQSPKAGLQFAKADGEFLQGPQGLSLSGHAAQDRQFLIQGIEVTGLAPQGRGLTCLELCKL